MRRRALLAASMSGNGEGPNNIPVDVNYLTIEALEDGLTVSMSLNACEYCVDGNREWRVLEAGTNTISVNAGQTLSFKGRLLPDVNKGIGTFTISKKCNLKGNCMSMLFDNYAAYNNLEGKQYAFYSLFYNCSNIVNVSENFLPATTLANYCYYQMFEGCTSLTSAPELPATTLVDHCYAHMFQYCEKLNYIKMLATDISAFSCLHFWVSGVASSGTFVKAALMTSLPTGSDGIPNGWTIKYDGEEDALFPAILIHVNFIENLQNAAIAQYFIDKYPDMNIGHDGNYTEISEDVQITGASVSDGKVVGVSRWTDSQTMVFIAFYTEASLSMGTLLRVAVSAEDIPVGSTYEFMYG